MHLFTTVLSFKVLLLTSLVMPLLGFLYILNSIFFKIQKKQDEQLLELRKNQEAIGNRIQKYSENCDELGYLNKRFKDAHRIDQF